MAPRRRIWSELLGYPELRSTPVLALLAQRGIELTFAVTPRLGSGAANVVRACRDAGVRVGVWPLLEPSGGRWASELTAEAIASFGERLLDDLAAAGALPDHLAIDLEPPFELLSRPTLARFARLAFGRRPHGGAERLAAWAEHARRAGVDVTVAAMPMVLADGPRRGWQALLATPVDRIAATDVSAMIYTSLIEGYSRGLCARADATAILAASAARVSRRNGGISLGAVGPGSLGDEPVYRTPAELAADVAIARGAGVDDLALFSLCGVLSRPPAEGWLDAFVHTAAAAAPPVTRRARAVLALMAAGSWFPADLRK